MIDASEPVSITETSFTKGRQMETRVVIARSDSHLFDHTNNSKIIT